MKRKCLQQLGKDLRELTSVEMNMNYITERRGSTLTNEPYEITDSDIRRMRIENQRDLDECRKVTESSYRGESYYADDKRPGDGKVNDFHMAFFKEVLYRDMKTAGFMMEYPHGVVISQGQSNSYYRGENQIYLKSQPSIYRALDRLESVEDRKIYRFVSEMRIAEFGRFLCRLGIVQFWMQNYGSVLFEPLAQHYGLETEWLDITSDFEVALFFATCGWDSEKRNWYPLTREQTESSPEKQYGVIFHIPQFAACTSQITSTLDWEGKEEYLSNVILPIGFQPFMRCHSQHAYGINMKKSFPLQEDITFEKLYFRHSEKLSREVFERMESGKKIYPQEGLNDFTDIIDKIHDTTEFSQEAFEYVLNNSSYFTSAREAESALLENEIFGAPIRILRDKDPIHVSRQRIRALNRKYEGFSIEKSYGIKLLTRSVFYGSPSA